jgi:hypothetical protein
MIVALANCANYWCPYGDKLETKASGTGGSPPIAGAATNRTGAQATWPSYSPCIGNVCMMWQFSDSLLTKGFCGLAGKPMN